MQNKFNHAPSQKRLVKIKKTFVTLAHHDISKPKISLKNLKNKKNFLLDF